MPDDHEQEAAKLGFDITKQFLTLAIGGIAFVVGLSYSTPSAVSSTLLWSTVAVFGASALFGLMFLMHGVSTLSIKKSYDVYATSLRLLAVLQILLMLGGVGLLCPILYHRPTSGAFADGKSIRIQVSPQQTLTYPVEPDKNYTVEIEPGGKVKLTASKP